MVIHVYYTGMGQHYSNVPQAFLLPHYMHIQWNPTIADTIGTIRSVLYKEVSLIHGLINTNMTQHSCPLYAVCPYFRVSTLRSSTVL